MMIIQYISCFYSNKTWYKYAICFRCAKQTIYTEKYVEEKKSNNNNAIIIRITIYSLHGLHHNFYALKFLSSGKTVSRW